MLSIPNFFPVAANLLISNLMKAQVLLRDQIEDAELFQIGYVKSQIAAAKREYFSATPIKKFLIVNSFNNYDFVSPQINERVVKTIWYEDFSKLSNNPSKTQDLMSDSIAILSNNTINRIGLEKFAEIYLSTPSTIYVLQDIDSHHWSELSLQISALVDVYAPGHSGSFVAESRINPHLVTGIPIGTTQWTKDFVLTQIPNLKYLYRLDQPFGMHSFYPKFKFRNQTIATLSKFSSYTGLQYTSETNSFLGREPLERWNQWTKHKLHWVMPVANDLPNRFFDALITGGLALTPLQFRTQVRQLNIPDEFVCYYNPLDVIDPTNFIDMALKQFESQGGNEGSIKRAQFALEYLHVDRIMNDLFNAALDFYC